ncbi:MAG: class III extradiol ring-cleavage dioxygenase [Alphaproteobacteria bacterium]
MRRPIYFLPHGGGPLPLMGHDGHRSLTAMMRGLGDEVAGSSAIIVVTAHWEEPVVTFSGSAHPSMLFDYYNFPPETYEYDYPAPGAPDLAREAQALLKNAGIKSAMNMDRGFDHGTFVPMMLIRPEADIPVLQMSLLASLDPADHIAVGKALASLLDRNITLIGSGLSFHNMAVLMRGQETPAGEDKTFDAWLNETLTDSSLPETDREAHLAGWADAPGARLCHPREEHLLPLHVCYGAAAAAGGQAETIFREPLMGSMTSSFCWQAQQ